MGGQALRALRIDLPLRSLVPVKVTYHFAAKGKHERGCRWGLTTVVLGLALVVPALVVAGFHQPVLAENVTNTTIHVPASVQTNPCFPPDVINLSGDIHIVIITTADSAVATASTTI